MTAESTQRTDTLFSLYYCQSKQFTNSPALGKLLGPERSSLLDALSKEGRVRLTEALEGMERAGAPGFCSDRYTLQTTPGQSAVYRIGAAMTEPGKTILLSLEDVEGDGQSIYGRTGLLNWEAFLARLDKTIQAANPEAAVVYFDIQRFKSINNMFGLGEGDRLLRHVASKLREMVQPAGFACHINADRFVYYTEAPKVAVELQAEMLFDAISDFDLPFEILCNAGVCCLEGRVLPANTAVDCAIIAQGIVKGSVSQRVHYYDDELHKRILGEEEIVGLMTNALQKGQFVPYFQPQYSHSTRNLVGAEALVRWVHPEKGMISPGQFIPVFEKNGFITQLDMHVFREVCAFQKYCMERDIPMVPISVNLTRYDLYDPGFLERLEAARERSGVPAKYIRLEITESSALGGSRFINEVLAKLHGCGYLVEMDDFGSGYSSLNILKDVDFDMVKLDMRFFEKESEGSAKRGGIILSSVVRMINWLQIPVIAEGVETVEQADFLKSIGCDYIQGYLYAKPMPEAEFEELLRESTYTVPAPRMRMAEHMDADRFWSSDSLEAMIFSNYVGGAAIFDYRPGCVELLRVNQKYLDELGMNLGERDVVNKNLLDFLDETGRTIFLDMLDKAIATGEEQACETWRVIASPCCGEDKVCIRCEAKVIARSEDRCIFYALIRNVTNEKQRWIDILDSERRFKAASEQANIYYWEYTVATKEMRPCFRCMRDLGLPALMTNYPESAFELGVIPPEMQEMYRDWHRQIAEGVPSLEAVIPLTVGRVPFHVRYTTEFDENGRPVKAYGSATLVVDGGK